MLASQSPADLFDRSIPLQFDWADAQLSPDNRWLAYLQTSGQKGLWLAKADLTGAQPIRSDQLRQTSTDAGKTSVVNLVNPAWSPNSKFLSFLSYEGLPPGENHRLWYLSPDNISNAIVVYEESQRLTAGLWSPNSKSIAVVDGEQLILVDLPHEAQMIVAKRVVVFPIGSRALAWSADGNWLAYPVMNAQNALELWIAEVSTEDRRMLMENEDASAIRLPSWCPDGGRIALLEGRMSPDSQIAPSLRVLNRDGEVQVDLQVLGTEFTPTTPVLWSPEGERIALILRQGAAFDVWMVNLNDVSYSQLTTDGNVSNLLRWSTDGKKLLIRTWEAIKPLNVSE